MSITWTCHSCGFPIADGDGAIVARYEDILRLGTVPFRTLHHACADEDGYSIDIERIRTEADVLWWTRHLISKDWFGRSTWRDVLTVAITREETA